MGGAKISGSKRVAWICAASDTRPAGSVGDEEHVAVEPGALVPRANLADDAEHLDGVAAGQLALECHHVVQQVVIRRHRNPELQRRRVLRADDAADRQHSVDVDPTCPPPARREPNAGLRRSGRSGLARWIRVAAAASSDSSKDQGSGSRTARRRGPGRPPRRSRASRRAGRRHPGRRQDRTGRRTRPPHR